MLQQSEQAQPCSLDEVGTPVLELFLKKDANGELQQQGTVLSIPPEILSQAQSSLSKLHCYAIQAQIGKTSLCNWVKLAFWSQFFLLF